MPTIDETSSDSESSARAGRGETLAWASRAVRVRSRFLVAFALASLVIGRWDVLRTYWDRWTSPMARDASMGAVSADTEYFCPMDPGVLTPWPSKCPVCFMALVRRSKGDMGALPSGAVARVQIAPGRLLLGGIRTEPVGYRPLMKEIRSVGPVTVERQGVSVACEVGAEAATWVEAGQGADVRPDPQGLSTPAASRVRSVEGDSLVVEVPQPPAALRASRFASVAIRRPVAGQEPFRSMPRGDPPRRPGEPRAFHACPDHPELIRVGPGRCPVDDRTLDRVALAKNQRLGWWCPMHPSVEADGPGRDCPACGGMPLVARVVTHGPLGEVLAVPDSAVVDTGLKTLVYVERMPGMFEGVEVRLGPRVGAYRPVIEGLEAGQRVVISGAFLVDAETRLNPSLAAGYFGSRRSEAVESKAEEGDRRPDSQQTTCPVTGKKLGTMGPPVRVEVEGRAVFLCCSACEGAIRDHPEKYRPNLQPAETGHHP